jgi:hypothetical protein
MSKRTKLLKQMTQIVEMRRGSLVRQTVPRQKEGVPIQERRGPYPLFSYKRQGKTVSRRIHSREEMRRLERQVKNFHRFQELCRQLIEVAEAICEKREQEKEN